MTVARANGGRELRGSSDVGMTRKELDAAMREALFGLSTCSHIPAANPQGGSHSSDESKGGNRPPGDLGPEHYARAYGPPFHTCTSRCDHRVKPAVTDARRLAVLEETTDELEHLRGYGQSREPRPEGETAEQFAARIVNDGAGWSVRDAAVHFRCGEQHVRRVRKAAGREPENGEATAPRVGRPRAGGRFADGPAAEARRVNLIDLVERRGYTIAAAARLLGVSRSTAERDLGKRAA